MTTPVRNESGYFNRNPYNDYVPYGETQPAPRRAPQRGPKPVSEKQVNLIKNLLDERDFDLIAWLDAQGLGGMTELTGGREGTASKLITALFQAARKDGQDTTRKSFTPEAGFYRKGEDVFRVVISKEGNWYAKVAEKRPNRATLQWGYVGKRVRLDDAQRLDDAEAGRFLGFCVRCNAELTDPESIARGLGPVCKDRVAA